jgi:hypothetical protein
MKRHHVLGILLTVLMAVTGAATAAGEQGHPAVGTWLITVELETPYDVLMTIHSDGTLLLSQSTEDFVGGCVDASTRQGVWEKDGPRGLIGTHIGFMYDCGAFTGYQRYRWTAEVLKDDPNTADATLYVDVYPSNGDPLDVSNPPPIGPIGPVAVIARRLTVIPPPQE